MPMPQAPTQYQLDDSEASSAFTSPASQLSMPQPGGPWYPPPNTQPAWSNQFWNNPAPTHAPPGQPPGPFGYQSGYNDPLSFPETLRPANYGYSMPQTPPILEPQQLSPGPPPPPPSRESLLPRSTSGRLPCSY
jgi:hypothetical protein